MVSKYPLYGKDEEDLDHILIQCPSVWGQWTNFLSAFGTGWVSLMKVKSFIVNWSQFPIVKRVWRAVSLTLSWAIWNERNLVTLEGATFSINRIEISIIRSFSLGWGDKFGILLYQADYVPFLWLCLMAFLSLVCITFFFACLYTPCIPFFAQ